MLKQPQGLLVLSEHCVELGPQCGGRQRRSLACEVPVDGLRTAGLERLPDRLPLTCRPLSGLGVSHERPGGIVVPLDPHVDLGVRRMDPRDGGQQGFDLTQAVERSIMAPGIAQRVDV